MSGGTRGVTVVIQRDGATRSQTLRFSLWAVRLGVLASTVLLAGMGLLAVLYFPVVRAAARVPGLERQVTRLRAENAMVRQLSVALDSAELRYEQLRRMIGADIVRDPLAISSTLPLAPALRARVSGEARPAGPGPTVPREWPLDDRGYITRGQVQVQETAGTREEAHPGLDIAVPVGTPVRASGGAMVNQIGDDPEYGYYVLLDHPEEYQTMYGHLSRIIVTDGQNVEAGEVIGLSGNSGRSTAPHLHFEIRQRGTSLDPTTMVKQGG
jgi:murein DD-endopeptidase MepM/ murein hydrolase activator NlpD